MIVHLPMLSIMMPANVSGFFSIILPIVTFDIIDPEWSTELLFDFDEPGQERLNIHILDQMQDLGYDSHNSMLNLGSLALFSFVYYVRLFMFFTIVKLFYKLG